MIHAGSLATAARVMAIREPAGLAVVDGARRWSWTDLDARSESVVAALRRAGVGPGDRVALVADPSAAAVAALHGIARLGAVAAPLPVGLRPRELAVAGRLVGPRLVLEGPGSGESAEALGASRLALDDAIEPRSRVDPAGSAVADPSVTATPSATANPTPDLSPDAAGDPAQPGTSDGSPALIVLTSGTTGRPKAVELSVAALRASCEAWLAVLPEATGWLLALGLGHVAGQGLVWRAALGGVPIVVLARPEPLAVEAALRAEPEASHVSLVPTILARLLAATGDRPPPATVRAVPLGGGPADPDLIRRAIAAGWPVIPTYGLSEAGSGVTALPTSEAAGHPTSAGRALPGVEVTIADRDGEGIGEIVVRSPARFSGYLGDPAATAAVLTADGRLRTGDLGRLDGEGRLTVVDRRTDRIVRGGENVSPAEIEAVLRDHPAVAEAAVIGRPDPEFGQVPVAVVVLRAGHAAVADSELDRHCRDRLARFKVPVAYVRRDALPRTATGKVRRDELRTIVEPGPRNGSPGRDDVNGEAGAGERRRILRAGGPAIVYRRSGHGDATILLLHGTLSNADQLGGLARALVGAGAVTVLAVDRRGSGRSRLANPGPVPIAVHLDDLVAVLDAEDRPTAALVGISYGGVIALEFAAQRPDRVEAVVAYEPPFGPVADRSTRSAFAAVARATEAAHRDHGPASAAEAFLRGVAGDAAWDRLPERSRAWLEAEGDGALVDAGLGGVDGSGPARIRLPVTILTGTASDPLYRPIAEALVARIPGARLVDLPGLRHASPITDPTAVADAVRSALGGRPTADPSPPAVSQEARP